MVITPASQRQPDRTCSDCGRQKPREGLLAKRVSWMTLGRSGKRVHTRTIKWQCLDCAQQDPEWNIEVAGEFKRRGGQWRDK